MNDMMPINTKGGLSINNEAQNVAAQAQEDAGFYKLMKFRKGHYFVDGEEIPLGTQYIAHAIGWTKRWIKFVGGAVLERKDYRVHLGERPPLREDMGDTDQSKWAINDITKQPGDPWVLQYMLPMENEAGDFCVFVTSSFGGKRAVADLCSAWARKAVRDPNCGQPAIKLRETMMPSKRFGDVPRPHFEIVAWDGVKEPVREVKGEDVKGEMDDEIPF